MRVLFIYTVEHEINDFWPVGLASIVSMTKHEGHKVKVLQFVNLKHSNSHVRNCVTDFNPHIVGFTSVVTQFPIVKELAALVKEVSPKTITICGGVHPTIYPECLFETTNLDGIFIGESEFSFVEFLDKLENNETYTDNDNFAYLDNGRLVKNKLKPFITNLDVLPFPNRINFTDSVEYIKKSSKMVFSFSRGCPYMCSYCSNVGLGNAYGLEANKRRYRSVESSIKEIEESLSEYSNVKKLDFVDENFGMEKSWMRQFAKEYCTKVGLPFECSSRANIMDEEYVSLLKSAGCSLLHIGLESGNKHIRNVVMGRNLSDEQLIRAYDLTHKYDIPTSTNIIIGVPGETEDTLRDSVKLSQRIKPTHYNLFMYYPFPGTKLGDYCFVNDLVDVEKASRLIEDPIKFDEGFFGTSVLKFPEDFKKRLNHMVKNWDLYVNCDNLKKSNCSKVQISINIDKITSFGDFGYQVEVPLEKEYCDSNENPVNSMHCLFENDQELGSAHAFHELIGLKGMGRYSVWVNTLYFSSSDNTDPRKNGRKYTLRYLDIPFDYPQNFKSNLSGIERESNAIIHEVFS